MKERKVINKMGKFTNLIKNTVNNLVITNKKTNNFAGGEAYQLTPKAEFVSILLTSFLKDSFYEKGDKTLDRLVNLMNKIDDKLFLAKAAIYARDKYNMRSVSHVVAGEIAKSVKGEKWTKDFFERVIFRVDDMMEILGYYFLTAKNNEKGKKRPIPNSMKKGFRMAFDKFDNYQIAKYKGENKSVKLIDIVNLIKPKPTERNETSLKELVNGTLKVTETWEAKISDAGKKATNEEEKLKLKEEAWKELIENRKIGYMALLRNIRNIINQAPELVDKACELLEDEKLIEKSKVLPFRFTTAISEIEKMQSSSEVRKVIMSINKAVDISLKNVPIFEGKTLIALDVSGSMQGKPAEIGSLFATVLAKVNINADLLLFDTRVQFKNINVKDSTTTIAKSLRFNGGGTDFHCIFNGLKKAYDRIIILSDMQGWVGYNTPTTTFEKYKQKFNCNPYIYSFDLLGYGTSQFPDNKVFCLYGFSDKIFDTIKLFEQDKNALVKDIENSITF